MRAENGIDGRVPAGVGRLWQRYYPDYRQSMFEDLVYQRVRPGDHVLEIGAGSGTGNQKHFELKGRVSRYVGVDPDSRILENPYLDEAHVGTADSLPFPDASFNMVFHSFVAEHFDRPFDYNREIARVLKPAGLLLFVTPSRFYYPMLAARVTPHWFHEFYIGRFASGRAEYEVFPTYYRLNDDRAISEQLSRCGFDCDIQHHSTPPGYLRFSRLAFLGGVFIERTVEKAFPSLRGQIIVIAKKQY